MTAAVGLDRLPRPVALRLAEAAGNLLAVTNRPDELLAGDWGALDAIVHGEGASLQRACVRLRARLHAMTLSSSGL